MDITLQTLASNIKEAKKLHFLNITKFPRKKELAISASGQLWTAARFVFSTSNQVLYPASMNQTSNPMLSFWPPRRHNCQELKQQDMDNCSRWVGDYLPWLSPCLHNCCQEDEYREMVAIAHTMEEDYGQYFDSVIPFEVNNTILWPTHSHDFLLQDVEFVMKQLMYEISLLEREPQWVPAKWVKDVNPLSCSNSHH